MQAEWLETSDLERFRHELEGEALVRMFDFWLDGLSGEVPPQKIAIVPLSLGKLLKRTFLYEYVSQHENFFLQVAGEDILDAHNGHHRRGAALDDNIPPMTFAVTKRRWTFYVNKPAVMFIKREIGNTTYSRRIVVPVVDGSRSYILGATEYLGTERGPNPFHVDEPSNYAVALSLESIAKQL